MKTRLDRIKDLLAEDPYLTGAMLARKVGVSRQRIHQIVMQTGIQLEKNSYNGLINKKISGPPKPRIKINQDTVVLPVHHTHSVGTISELIVAADLIARGWHVFWPFVRNTVCDLIASSRDGRDILRIEVRSGSRSESGSLRYIKKDTVCDHYAVVVTCEPVIYDPPLK